VGDQYLDIKPGWYNVVRHMQSICTGNNTAYGVVTIKVIVKGNEPIMWEKGTLSQIQPTSMANVNLSPTLALLLSSLLPTVDGEP
jgi:hypothetical protein